MRLYGGNSITAVKFSNENFVNTENLVKELTYNPVLIEVIVQDALM